MEHRFVVHHIEAQKSGRISEVLLDQLAISSAQTQTMLFQGSIWADSSRRRSDDEVAEGCYMRVHMQPRRFPIDKIDWRNTIIFEDEDMVVINKPVGIPVHATVDNYVENVAYALEQALSQPIFVTQRLDTATGGVLLLAKTKWFQGQFNKLLRERSVQKHYTALLENEVALGEHIHFMENNRYAPRHISRTPKENWLECRLIVKSCIKTELGFDTQIELLTGRTHQIRAQMADLGAPLLGDEMYGSILANPWAPKEYEAPESIALKASKLEFAHPSKQINLCFEA